MAVDFGLEDRVLVITGGGGGIGAATAVEAARQGATIAILDLRAEAMADTVAEVERAGGRAQAFEADVRDEESQQSAMDAIESTLGPIYGVVPAAGITRPSPGDRMPLDDWDSVVGINLTGTFLTARAAAQRMIPRGEGAMVLIASTAGLGGIAGRANYSSSKHGVIGLAKSLAIDWGPSGIRVNVVAPGPVDTPMFRAATPQETVDRMYLPRLPLRRLARPEDQARAIVYLLSQYADYITGAVLSVDGGVTAGYHTQLAP